MGPAGLVVGEAYQTQVVPEAPPPTSTAATGLRSKGPAARRRGPRSPMSFPFASQPVK